MEHWILSTVLTFHRRVLELITDVPGDQIRIYLVLSVLPHVLLTMFLDSRFAGCALSVDKKT